MITLALLLAVIAIVGMIVNFKNINQMEIDSKQQTPKQQLEQLLNSVYGDNSVKDLRVAVSGDEISFQGVIKKGINDEIISDNINKCISG